MMTQLYIARYGYLLRRIFGRFHGLDEAAAHIDVLCPQETSAGEPAVYLPGQLDKVIRLQEDVTQETERAKIMGDKRVHAPTIALHVSNAKLFDGTIYKGRHKYRQIDYRGRGPIPLRSEHITSGVLVSSYGGLKYFGQWLTEDCTRYLLAARYGVPICVRGKSSPDKDLYGHYFGQDWSPLDRAIVDRLTFFQDFSQNSLKRERYRLLRKAIRKHVAPSRPGGIVYLARGETGTPRIVDNEKKILEVLSRYDIQVVTIFENTLEEIASTLLDAKLVISPEGSHLTHATYTLSDNSSVIALQPPDRFCNFHRDWTECLGMRYGFVVGETSIRGYTVEPNDILRTIDLILRH